jgi:hypothetical protein
MMLSGCRPAGDGRRRREARLATCGGATAASLGGSSRERCSVDDDDPARSPWTFTAVLTVSIRRSMGSRMAIAPTGKPTDCKTMIIVTIPALGRPGAPMEAG